MATSLRVKIDSDNEAFSDGNAAGEVARILRELAARIEDSHDGSGNLRDFNGNRVGHWSLAVED